MGGIFGLIGTVAGVPFAIAAEQQRAARKREKQLLPLRKAEAALRVVVEELNAARNAVGKGTGARQIARLESQVEKRALAVRILRRQLALSGIEDTPVEVEPVLEIAVSSAPTVIVRNTAELGAKNRGNELVESGFVYVLVNSAVPGMVKIGQTGVSTEKRAEEISRATGVPLPWMVAYEEELVQYESAERELHKRLEKYRVNSQREFFCIPLKEAIAAVREVAEEFRKAT